MFKLIDLPYSLEALEPVISARTLEFHYGKHHKAYVDNLNNLIKGTEYENLTLEDVIRTSIGTFFQNAGQVLNHNYYFQQFAPANSIKRKEPQGPLAQQIIKQWGSFEAFKETFVAEGLKIFGSGWVWLDASNDGFLQINQEAGANNPIARGLKPILTFDVWEHAYYLDYQNRRADQLKALWEIVDWRVVEERFK